MHKLTFPVSVLLALVTAGHVGAQVLSQNVPEHASKPAAGVFPAPLGASVLYAQGGVLVNTVTAQEFPDLMTHSSEMADDFTVADPNGWTVTSVAVQDTQGAGAIITNLRYAVNIYPDVNGAPGTQPYCGGRGLAPQWNSTQTLVTVALPAACYLPAGTWWMSATPQLNLTGGGSMFRAVSENPVQLGAQPRWRNPLGGWGGNCRAWTALVRCPDLFNVILTPTEGMTFQIIGNTGGVPGRVSLTVGLAPANGNPAQCGTATTLSATAGDQINFCYTLTNNTPVALTRQSLRDTVIGDILNNTLQSIPPGGSYQFNRTITASASQSPTTTWTSSDRLPGYAASTTPYAYVPINTTGTAITLINDAGSTVTMPFSFTYYGITSNQLCINNNGIVFFNRTTGCDGYFFNFNLPNGSQNQTTPFFAPYWDDFYSGGGIYWQTVGDAPNRRFVVEYYQRRIFQQSLAPTYVSGPGQTFQMILNEADGSIDFNYESVSQGVPESANLGGAATIGLQNTQFLADLFSFNGRVLTNQQNIHWTVATTVTHSSSATVTLDVGAPIISALPNPLGGTAAVGSSATVPLYISNTGNRPLVWQQTPPAPASHFPMFEAYTLPFHPAAETEVGAAPVTGRGAVPAQVPEAVTGGSAVPAFGVAYYEEPFGPSYVNLDAANATPLTTVLPLTQRYFAGAFANNDFSRQYVVDSPGRNLYTIDTATGVQTLIGSTGVAATETVSGIRWDSSTNNAYLMTTSCGIAPYRSTLYRLDLTTGATTLVGNIASTCIIDIAITPLGLMYGVDVLGDNLRAINKTTAAVATLGTLGFNANYAQGMDFDASTGILYLAGYTGQSGAMYTLNLTSGRATLISPLGPNVQMDAFAIARPIPVCLRPISVPWLSNSVLSGVIAPGAFVTNQVTLDATTLKAGTHTTSICLSSNDVQRPVVTVPVTFTVTSAAPRK